MFQQHFIFSNHYTLSSNHLVTPEDLYTKEKAYGFVTESNKNTIDLLKIPELNSGFDPWYWLNDKVLSKLNASPQGVFIAPDKKFISNDWPIPLHFKLDVPKSGNYTLSINLTNIGEDTEVFIFTGRRRLMTYLPCLKAAATYAQTYSVNVTDIIPRSKNDVHTDNTLDLTIISKGTIALSHLSVTTSQAPTLYIASDSTATDQNTCYPYHPYVSYCGWGQMLSCFMTSNIAISNHAHSGLTSETFRSEGHYKIILDLIKPNDFILFQFGHNDQKLSHLSAYEGYANELIRYIKEIKAKGAYPILVTPLARNTWRSNGVYNDLLEDYSNACLHLARKENIYCIDLHQASMTFIKEHNVEASKAFFFPNDYTHTNDYGGFQMAAFVASLIKELNMPGLSTCVSTNIKDQQLSFTPPSSPVCIPKPPPDYIEVNKVSFIDIDNPTSLISRAEVLQWIVKAVGFVPTNVYNDHYIDVIGHEWYAGTVEVAYQNGIIDHILTPNNMFSPSKIVTSEELFSFLINSYKCRKLISLIPNSTTHKVSPFAFTAICIAEEIGLLETPFSANTYVTKQQAAHYIEKLMTLL